MKRPRNTSLRIVLILLSLLGAKNVRSQDGRGGVESPFSMGIGARALGMGSVGAAYPLGPSAFYWNPAGMVLVEQKELGVSLTTLFEESQYNFIGYIHPTLNTGTFALGVMRIGTGGIFERSWDRGTVVEGGEMNYWWGRMVLAYGVSVFPGFSLGVSLDVNRQVLGSFSTNGFGVDAGAHYSLPFDSGFLRGVHFGLKISNAIRPRLKLGTEGESLPLHARFGLAKMFRFRDDLDHWMIAVDLERSSATNWRYHAGMEYAWNRRVFLRVGIDGGEVTFGGGLRFHSFQLDYGTSRIADPLYFPRNHRFSLIFHFGRSLRERREELEERRSAEIQRRFDERVEADRSRRIEEGLRAGREYFDQQDYFNARLEFSRVLREDPGNGDAREMLGRTTQEEQELQNRREEELLRTALEKDEQIRDNAFISERYAQGLEAFEELDFRTAISRWEEALERDPENEQIHNYIDQAHIELENEVNRLIARAEQLIRQENISEAYRVLDQAKDQTLGNTELRDKVQREIIKLDRLVDFLNHYQEGQRRYGNGDYEGAARSFQRALEYAPNNERVRELYRNSTARSMGEKKTMEGDVRSKFNEGIRLYRDGRYEEAVAIWEEALQLDPHNIHIIEAIEGARKKLDLYKKKE